VGTAMPFSMSLPLNSLATPLRAPRSDPVNSPAPQQQEAAAQPQSSHWAHSLVQQAVALLGHVHQLGAGLACLDDGRQGSCRGAGGIVRPPRNEVTWLRWQRLKEAPSSSPFVILAAALYLVTTSGCMGQGGGVSRGPRQPHQAITPASSSREAGSRSAGSPPAPHRSRSWLLRNCERAGAVRCRQETRAPGSGLAAALSAAWGRGLFPCRRRGVHCCTIGQLPGVPTQPLPPFNPLLINRSAPLVAPHHPAATGAATCRCGRCCRCVEAGRRVWV
jgi:hypothetical protein